MTTTKNLTPKCRRNPRSNAYRLIDRVIDVKRKIPEFLKLHVADETTEEGKEQAATAIAPPPASPRIESGAVAQFCDAFTAATGWRLAWQGEADLAQNAPAEGVLWSTPVTVDGRLIARLAIAPSDCDPPSTQLTAATELAQSFARVLGELESTRDAVWKREAELAAGVPIAARPQEESHLAERMTAVLQGGADAVGCNAAAVYLLDEATTELKMRACWGLPKERLLDPPRALRGSIADLEALVGHAVVLEDTNLLKHWHCPEKFPSAVCVPVSTASTPLGTLWMYCDIERDFTPHQTNLIEIVAGRIASDLEREMLLSQGVQSKRMERGLSAAAYWQRQRIPSVSPLLEGWQIAGWTDQAEGVGGDFHDWMTLPDGRLCLAVGDAEGGLIESGFSAAVAQAALRTHLLYSHDPKKLMTGLNDTLWRGSAGDEFVSLLYAILSPETGLLEYSIAGNVAALLVRQGRYELLHTDAPSLGSQAEPSWRSCKRTMQPGDVLVALSQGARNARDAGGLKIGETAFANLIRRHPRSTAKSLLEGLKKTIITSRSAITKQDSTLLVLRRRP